ncbi:hypothetical protein NLJ89_g3152 [Agrocybe chaxingu]|uniref:Uncharacterized protein n=1 Tax=Agrocybe chaxingu TaxID=84603 RepID=A0A9W8K5F9_9AGAR|nr:hypothetical protein NLJ89_g3152 [Agrocybe chaxingu]
MKLSTYFLHVANVFLSAYVTQTLCLNDRGVISDVADAQPVFKPSSLPSDPEVRVQWDRSDFELDPWYKCAAASKGFLYQQMTDWIGQVTGVRREPFDEFSDLTGNQADHVVEVQVLIFALDVAEITPAMLDTRAKERLKRVLNGLTNMFYVTGGTNGSKGSTIRNILREQQYNARVDVVQYMLETCRAGLNTARMLDNILEQVCPDFWAILWNGGLMITSLAQHPSHGYSANMISAIAMRFIFALFTLQTVSSLCFGHETNVTHTPSFGRSALLPAPTEVHTRDAVGNPNGVVQEHFDEFADLTGNQTGGKLPDCPIIYGIANGDDIPRSGDPGSDKGLRQSKNHSSEPCPRCEDSPEDDPQWLIQYSIPHWRDEWICAKGVTIRNVLDGQQYTVRRDVAQYMLLTCRNALDTARILDNILRSVSAALDRGVSLQLRRFGARICMRTMSSLR